MSPSPRLNAWSHIVAKSFSAVAGDPTLGYRWPPSAPCRHRLPASTQPFRLLLSSLPMCNPLHLLVNMHNTYTRPFALLLQLWLHSYRPSNKAGNLLPFPSSWRNLSTLTCLIQLLQTRATCAATTKALHPSTPCTWPSYKPGTTLTVSNWPKKFAPPMICFVLPPLPTSTQAQCTLTPWVHSPSAPLNPCSTYLCHDPPNWPPHVDLPVFYPKPSIMSSTLHSTHPLRIHSHRHSPSLLIAFSTVSTSKKCATELSTPWTQRPSWSTPNSSTIQSSVHFGYLQCPRNFIG